MMVQKRKKYRERSLQQYKVFQDAFSGLLPGESKEIKRAFHEALEHLPKQPARAMQLYVEEDMRRKEVATEMGLSDNTVKTHLAVAMKVMRKKMLNLR